jgi:Na+/proline symporter
MFYGLKAVDIAMIVGYFVLVMGIGFWAARRVKSEADYFMGGRSFGKALLVMHWLATGTHSEQAVQVTGATARGGLGGIWYQWMWLFSTPFYWLIAPITRRMRVMTTGDFFRIRYGRSLEMLYSVVALAFYIQSMAMLLRGAGAAISGATGGAIPTEQSVVVLSILFSTYVMAGGLVAAAYTDFLQGTMIIVLSVLLVPAGLNLIGGMPGLHQGLDPAMLAVTAPAGAKEGDPWFVMAMSILGLVGIVVQPHTMTATGSGKTEMEARVGMCYGNFIKRFLTIAWAFTGLIAAVQFPEVLQGLQGEAARDASETLFGRSILVSLGDGWRGLMIACLIAGVTSAETFMVVGASLFTRNFYEHVARGRTDRHYLWVGRAAAVAMLGLGITVAFFAGSVTQILLSAIQLIGLLGAGFWLGVVWRRANATGVWAGFLGGFLVWAATSFKPELAQGIPLLEPAANAFVGAAKSIGIREIYPPIQILMMLAVEFGLLILVSLLTKPHPAAQLDAFYARLHTPVGREAEMRLDDPEENLPESATLGMEGVLLDYRKSSALVYPRLQKLGIEIPRMGVVDWGGFLAAWVLVGLLIALLIWLAGIGR